ncbi:aldolase/citrate lyase family protein [Allopusillimonas ginsengisoli]|uniref:aldolase/citrate lyase family protein n=1 Tax=Allopusillimonas ginsengisoli TaxID=453575 RepID=UPI0010C22511|nr:4-hydroxy-2-oxo-heptane-1,7-dioate aldolase [Allopusillimonas ginsengisoli]
MPQVPINRFKIALQQKRHQLGLWSTLCSPYSAEIIARAGFDWLLFDMEHSPSEITTVLGQLQAVAPYPVSPVLRPTWKDIVQQKRLLDIGAQTMLIPYVESAEEAAQAVAGMRYPPRGVRGVGGTSRASGFGQVKDYMQACEDQLCLLVQIESLKGLENVEAIASIDGVDGVFIGPADLSANMGHLGQPGHKEVQSAIEEAIVRILACGKAPGILTANEDLARGYIEQGCLFTAVGIDMMLLARGAEALAERFNKLTQ